MNQEYPRKGEQLQQSPEVHDEHVKEDLDQENVTHMGEWRTGASGSSVGKLERGQHLGATEEEVVPVVPPMSGPADVVGEQDQNAQGNESGGTEVGEESFDPRDELTPG